MNIVILKTLNIDSLPLSYFQHIILSHMVGILLIYKYFFKYFKNKIYIKSEKIKGTVYRRIQHTGSWDNSVVGHLLDSHVVNTLPSFNHVNCIQWWGAGMKTSPLSISCYMYIHLTFLRRKHKF